MNKLISIVLGCALVLFVPALAVAQSDELKNTTPQERAAMLTEMMQSDLSLDEKASTAVSAINLKYANETQTLMDSSESKFGKLMTFKKNADAKDAELKGVLTPEQYTQYEAKKAEIQETVKQKLMEKYQASQ